MNSDRGRILFFSPSMYPCACAGMEIFNYHIISSMAPLFPIVLATCCRNPLPGVKIMPLHTRLFGIRRFGFGKISIVISTLSKLLLIPKKPVLICVSCTSSTGYYGLIFPLIKLIRRIPYMIIMHGGALKMWRPGSGNKQLFHCADRILAVSEPIREEISRRSGRPVEIILPLLPFERSQAAKTRLRQKLGLDDQDQVIVNVGSLKPLKGVEDVLEAFLSLPLEFVLAQHLVLIFAGDGPLRKNLEKRAAAQPGFAKAVRFLGNIPYPLIPEIYGAADFFIMASLYEGTPLALLEAMFNGLAIVAADVRGIKQLIKNHGNGLLFAHGDRGALREALRILGADPLLSARLGKAAAEYFHANFKFSRTVASLKEIFSMHAGDDPQ